MRLNAAITTALVLLATAARAEPPAWAISGIRLGMGFDEAKAALDPQGEVQVARQQKADGTGPFDRALVLYVPNQANFQHDGGNSSQTLILFDEASGHRVVEVVRRSVFVAGQRPSPEAANAAVAEAYGVRMKPVSDFGREKYEMAILFDAAGKPTQSPACRRETIGVPGGLSAGVLMSWAGLDESCGPLLAVWASEWTEPGKPVTFASLDQHMIDTQATIADLKQKSALRTGAAAATMAAEKSKADRAKPAL